MSQVLTILQWGITSADHATFVDALNPKQIEP
jgi:hypothetical protein